MADKADKSDKPTAQAAEPPKPVHIGGESFVDRILPHLKKIVIAAVIIAVVLSVVVVIRWFGERKEKAATEQLDDILEIARQPIRGKDEPEDPKRPTHASAKARAETLLGRSGVDAAGPVFLGGLYLDAGRFDEAVATYRKGSADKTITGVMCREGVGLALEAKATAEKDPAARQKGLEEALAAFAAMQPDETGPRRAYALYHQGRMQVLLNKRDEARKLFEAAKEANKDADRVMIELVEKRLAALGAS
jgi:tetratricopeptide (TPR) repeat protein